MWVLNGYVSISSTNASIKSCSDSSLISSVISSRAHSRGTGRRAFGANSSRSPRSGCNAGWSWLLFFLWDELVRELATVPLAVHGPTAVGVYLSGDGVVSTPRAIRRSTHSRISRRFLHRTHISQLASSRDHWWSQ